MNLSQAAFLAQARADYAMHLHLVDQPLCHQLHFLQMAAEKLSKAYFYGTPAASRPSLDSHAVVGRFLHQLAGDRAFRSVMGLTPRRASWFLGDVAPLGTALERLAPALAGDGPNPEYPWPRLNPATAPIDHDFPEWRRWSVTPAWGRLHHLIATLLDRFEQL